MPRPNTSIRPPLIAGVRGRKLSDMLRAWRRQPRKRSPALFWGLVALAVGLDVSILLLGTDLVGGVGATLAPERCSHVPHARNAVLWEPLRHWVIRVDGRPQLFESFCRRSVRTITGTERFEDNDPLPLVVSWMLDAVDSSAWDDRPFLRCDDPELRAVVGEEDQSGTYIEPAVLRRSKGFHQLLNHIAARGDPGDGTRLSPLEKQTLALRDRLARFERIRGGVDGGTGEEMQAASAALREAYNRGDADLFAAAVADFVGASRRALRMDDDVAGSRRLACEGWLNDHVPFRRAANCSLLAAGLLAAAGVIGVRRPSWRRGFLVSGLLACAACLSWSAAGFGCWIGLHGGPVVPEGPSALLWLSCLTMALGLLLALSYRDGFPALAGTLVSAVGFALAERGSIAPDVSPGDVGRMLHVLAWLSAGAALTLAWGLSALTLGRIVLAPPEGKRLRRLAAQSARAVVVALALLTTCTALGVLCAARSGYSPPVGDAPTLGTLFALPCCAVLLFVRRVGWLAPAGLMMASGLGFTAILLAWQAALPFASGAWVAEAALGNVALVVHAALRYYFGRQRALGF